MVYHSVSEVDFSRSSLPALPLPRKVLLTTPAHFDVEYVINPHMEGHIGSVDLEAARQQWRQLRDTYSEIGIQVASMEGQEGLPDMVFCANQSLPAVHPKTGEKRLVLSRMYAEQRRGEVPHYRSFFEREGYNVLELTSTESFFEGMGDALWHPRRHLLWGGYGMRTEASAYDAISRGLDVAVCALHLEDPDFYHLDTCLSMLNETTALYFPGAFDEEGRALLERLFDTLIEADEQEARDLFAVNAHCPDEQHVIIQEGCEKTSRRLADAGFEPIPVDTSEFLKAGGSVFCMKLMYW